MSGFQNVSVDNLDNHVSGASLSDQTTGWLPEGPGESGWISVLWLKAWHTSAYTQYFMAAGASWQASFVIPVR